MASIISTVRTLTERSFMVRLEKASGPLEGTMGCPGMTTPPSAQGTTNVSLVDAPLVVSPDQDVDVVVRSRQHRTDGRAQ